MPGLHVGSLQCLQFKALKLFCEASPNDLGACLVHVKPNSEERPVVYASHSLSQTEQTMLK